MRLPVLLLTFPLVALASMACGTPAPSSDAGIIVEEDAGVDAGTPDAGRKPPVKRDAGTPDAGFGPFPVEQWCDMYAMARCHRLERCLSLSQEMFPKCVARVKETCDQAAYTSAVADGRLQYLSQEAAHCINAFGHGACDIDVDPEACEPVFQGLVPPDGGCILEEECQVGSYCLTFANTCPYTCHAYKQIGEPCNFWEQQCDPDVARCANPDGGGNRCMPLGFEGATCQFWSDCQPDMGCIDGICIKLYAGIGEPCRVVSTWYPYCNDDAFCRQEPVAPGQPADGGICVQRAGLGGVCTGADSCARGLRCSSTYATGTCIPLGGLNDSCSNDSDCQEELYCAPELSRCVPLPTAGGDCGFQGGSSYECAPGHYCRWESATDTYACQPRRQLGEPCDGVDSYCISGACEYGPMPDGGNGYRCIEACLDRLDGGF